MKNRIIDYFILFVGGCLIFTVVGGMVVGLLKLIPRDGFWLVLGEQTQLTVQEFYDKFEMKPVMVIIDTAN